MKTYTYHTDSGHGKHHTGDAYIRELGRVS